jgi:hypothetical protein
MLRSLSAKSDTAAAIRYATAASVVFAPAPHLSESQQNAIAIDYGMLDGSIQIETREALLLYLLQQLPYTVPLDAQGIIKLCLRIVTNSSLFLIAWPSILIEYEVSTPTYRSRER